MWWRGFRPKLNCTPLLNTLGCQGAHTSRRVWGPNGLQTVPQWPTRLAVTPTYEPNMGFQRHCCGCPSWHWLRGCLFVTATASLPSQGLLRGLLLVPGPGPLAELVARPPAGRAVLCCCFMQRLVVIRKSFWRSSGSAIYLWMRHCSFPRRHRDFQLRTLSGQCCLCRLCLADVALLLSQTTPRSLSRTGPAHCRCP